MRDEMYKNMTHRRDAENAEKSQNANAFRSRLRLFALVPGILCGLCVSAVNNPDWSFAWFRFCIGQRAV